MDVAGCRIIATLNADGDDGFTYVVSRIVGSRIWLNPMPPDAVIVDRGPFLSQLIAQQFAHSWKDANTPPPMPSIVSSKVVASETSAASVVKTISENEAVQVAPTVENPPIAEKA